MRTVRHAGRLRSASHPQAGHAPEEGEKGIAPVAADHDRRPQHQERRAAPARRGAHGEPKRLWTGRQTAECGRPDGSKNPTALVVGVSRGCYKTIAFSNAMFGSAPGHGG